MPIGHKEPRFSLDDSEWLPRYEADVREVVFRRVVQVLFASKTPLALGDLLANSHASVNSVAAAFQTLRDRGLAELIDRRVALTKQGRRVLLRERRNLFFPRVTVRYRTGTRSIHERKTKADSFVDGRLPDTYRLGEIDMGMRDE
jgi:hypothetical protein